VLRRQLVRQQAFDLQVRELGLDLDQAIFPDQRVRAAPHVAIDDEADLHWIHVGHESVELAGLALHLLAAFRVTIAEMIHRLPGDDLSSQLEHVGAAGL
jgi:hypothetical protein